MYQQQNVFIIRIHSLYAINSGKFRSQCDAWEFNETLSINKEERSFKEIKIKFRFKTCSWLKMKKNERGVFFLGRWGKVIEIIIMVFML